MSEGWIYLHRKLLDNRFWTCEPFTRGQAWVDLLLLANHTDSFFYVRGNKVNVKTGQVAWSEPKLAERWQWSRTKVRKFISDLEKEQQIEQQKNFITQVITIVNYKEYQKKEQQEDSRKTAEEQQKDVYNKCIINDNECIINDNRDLWDQIFLDWFKFKSEKKQSYKEKGMKEFIKQLLKFSENNHIKAREIISKSMANNWAGIFEPKNNNNKPNTLSDDERLKKYRDAVSSGKTE